ncbi:MAG: diguanylate cyclase (GGDEF)-like protein [Myxococcota bacterium]|jgi:diguanylate cyclase (GGDEF)-like protein
MTRFALPIVAPILIVPAILIYNEPENHVAAMSMVAGSIAILYSIVGGALERSSANPFWVALANAVVYSSIISLLLWTFSTFDPPREHLHWVIFFLYSLMIAANGLSEDPRQPVMAGAFAIAGYAIVVLALRPSNAAGDSAMALRVASEFEWVANSAKVVLLCGIPIVAGSSAQRGRDLRRSSLRDGLTGLLNRHALDQCLEHLGQSAERENHTLTIAMIDIDHFKQLNDEYGHQAGDDVLRGVAGWLLRGFRATDLVARYGGEEFVVAFPDTIDQKIDERLEELRNDIADFGLRARGSDKAVSVTVSIGAARLPDDGKSVQDVLAIADSRLYVAKNGGRNRVVLR